MNIARVIGLRSGIAVFYLPGLSTEIAPSGLQAIDSGLQSIH